MMQSETNPTHVPLSDATKERFAREMGLATSDEVAKWIVAISAPSVTWITGQIFSVEGGMSL